MLCSKHCHRQSLRWGRPPLSRLKKQQPCHSASGRSAELSSGLPAQREAVQPGSFQGSGIRPYGSCGSSAAVRHLLVHGRFWRCMQSSPAHPADSHSCEALACKAAKALQRTWQPPKQSTPAELRHVESSPQDAVAPAGQRHRPVS